MNGNDFSRRINKLKFPKNWKTEVNNTSEFYFNKCHVFADKIAAKVRALWRYWAKTTRRLQIVINGRKVPHS